MMYLTMAEYYGWKPKGTKRPEKHDRSLAWLGNYDTPDGQVVGPADAADLAAIVTHALSDPNFDRNAAAMEKQMKEEVASRVEPELLAAFQVSFDRATFKAFGTFCSKGQFRIE